MRDETPEVPQTRPPTRTRRHRSEYTDDPLLKCAQPKCIRKKKPGYKYCATCKYSLGVEMGKAGYFTDKVEEMEARRARNWGR